MTKTYELNFDGFVRWCVFKEPTIRLPIDPLTLDTEEDETTPERIIISDYSLRQLSYAFEDACGRVGSLQGYMSSINFRNLVFNYALHIAITNSTYTKKIQKEVDDEGGEKTVLEVFDTPEEALQQLYLQYSAQDITAGIVNSTSSASSSSSASLPKSITDGDLETSFLVNTPYGMQAEIYLESIKGVVV